MKLLTKDLEATLERYPLYSQDGKGGKAKVLAKFFLPATAWTWYVLEGARIDLDEDAAEAYGTTAGPSWEFFGITINDQHPAGEYGYFTLAELEGIVVNVPVKDQHGNLIGTYPQRIERDQHFTPRTIEEIGGIDTYDDKDED